MQLWLLAAVFPAWTVATQQDVFLWPVPQSVQSGQVELNLATSFHIDGPSLDGLQQAIDRYTLLITRERWIPVQVGFPNVTQNPTVASQSLESLQIFVSDPSADLGLGVNESYTLHIPTEHTQATLHAATVWGAMHGLETFSQLVQARVHREQDQKVSTEKDADGLFEDTLIPNIMLHTLPAEEQSEDWEGLFIPKAPWTIVDRPRFSHRGLMLDTSRNFYSVFHWHITDSHSFPIQLEEVPELANRGAYTLHGKQLVYTQADVANIVRYARLRGIRVIPEIDMPAHTGSWGEAHKDITTCTEKFYLSPSGDWKDRYAAEPGSGQLNPVKEKTYTIVEKVIRNVAQLFPDAYYHGGGDEPVDNCWLEDPTIRDYLKQHNATTTDLLKMFLNKELEYIRQSNKTAVLWEDPVTNLNLEIPKNVVLQSWTNPVQLAAKRGYKVIAAHSSFWYLDCGHGGWGGNDHSYDEQVSPKIPKPLQAQLEKFQVEDNYRPPNWGGSGGDWCSPFKSWQRVYSYDPTFNLTKEEAQNVLGGEVALWSEQSDETVLDARLWPRTAAAAEVLWSGRFDATNVQRNVGDAMPRMFDWRYRLLRRGIRAEPLQPLWW
ncbi:glycoside hydrolase superfamily [Radiomyces spectabilis]|uniref:glycoside hydrolase superfamily n=1 Tax=Radiomyces spectabilis TaxID=64574 RepID=UPI00221F63B7|nr:glycoside hydrolase superfamily [Radiomyces spectabilis]KAI8369441.1 glycoside hydrolase superfamily [Radiomyces spectabilis]